jgi:hypothetical protein
LVYYPNQVDNKGDVDIIIYLKDSDESILSRTKWCNLDHKLFRGVSAGAAFADAYSALIINLATAGAALELQAAVKGSTCLAGFTSDVALQIGLFYLIEKYKGNKNILLVNLFNKVSLPSAGASCLTAVLGDKCNWGCGALIGAMTSIGEQIIKQKIKEGINQKSTFEFDLSYTDIIIQAVAGGGAQFLSTFVKARKGKTGFTDNEIDNAIIGLKNQISLKLYIKSLLNKNIREAIIDQSDDIARKYFDNIVLNPANYPPEYVQYLTNFND